MSPRPLPAEPAPPLHSFTSSFAAFALPLPAARAPQCSAIPPGSPVSSLLSGLNVGLSPSSSDLGRGTYYGAAFGRKTSMLGAVMQRQESPEVDTNGLPLESDEAEAEEALEDDPMLLGSPTTTTFEHAPLSPHYPNLLALPPSTYWTASTQSSSGPRSRSTSVSMRDSSNPSVPVSPVSTPINLRTSATLQRTPPPFLQRRLFNGLDDDLSSSSSGSREMEDAMGDREEWVGLHLADTLDGGEDGADRVVKTRPVARKPNLLPKPKSHLRVLSQLRSEDGPALEIASEATLHRLSRSAASTIPGPRLPSTPSVNHSQPLPTPSSSHGGLPFACRPTPNRFPEQVDEEEDRDKDSDASGDGEAEEGSEFGGMSMGYATEDEEERKVALWTGIRGAGSDKTGTTFGMGTGNIGNSSPGSERGKMELDQLSMMQNSPSGPGFFGASIRPGKRKMTEDRFDRFAEPFYSKRRAVSPASASPSMLHPPLPPPMTSMPISIPSPTLPHHSLFFSSLAQSRAGSPVPSSLSSSAGRTVNYLSQPQGAIMGLMSGRVEREEGVVANGGAQQKLGEAGDTLGRMTLE